MGSLIGHVVQVIKEKEEIAKGHWLPYTPYGFMSQIMKEYGIEGS